MTRHLIRTESSRALLLSIPSARWATTNDVDIHWDTLQRWQAAGLVKIEKLVRHGANGVSIKFRRLVDDVPSAEAVKQAGIEAKRLATVRAKEMRVERQRIATERRAARVQEALRPEPYIAATERDLAGWREACRRVSSLGEMARGV